MLFIKDYNQWVRIITIDLKGLHLMEANVTTHPNRDMVSCELQYTFMDQPKTIATARAGWGKYLVDSLDFETPVEVFQKIHQDLKRLANNLPIQKAVIDGRTLK